MRSAVLAVSIVIGIGFMVPANANVQVKPQTSLTLPKLPPVLSANDVNLLKKAIARAKKGNFDGAMSAARRASDPLLEDLTRWMWYKDRGARPRFADVMSFANNHKHWPSRRAILNTAERAALTEERGPDKKAWFDDHPPRTWEGRELYALSLMDAGEREKATANLRNAWIEGDFTGKEEASFLARHGQLLNEKIHAQKISWLLWQKKTTAAKRLLPKISGEARKVADAHIALLGGSEKLMRKLPADMVGRWPALLKDAVRHYRRSDRPSAAKTLAAHGTGRPPKKFAGRWWTEQHILARELMEAGDPQGAYDVVAPHGQSSGADYAEAEWFLGWLALRRLNDPDRAFKHFATLYQSVGSPISKARAGYWAGRAAEVQNNAGATRFWYTKASRERHTYYGQLAAHRLGRREGLFYPAPVLDQAAWFQFNELEMVRAARMMALAGDAGKIDGFLFALARTLEKKHDSLSLGVLANEVGRSGRLVLLGKAAARTGNIIPAISYPLHPFPEAAQLKRRPELALLHAVSRQESALNPEAVSPAGARGLMQLMPATAKMVAKQLKVPFNKKKLTQDPDYNALLGMKHLQDLIEKYKGSYVLALAAYNAGGHRANQWIERFGDPRDSNVDVVDWVEMIPFDETRNYVQRITESLQVYRTRLNGGPIFYQTLADISRGNP